MILVDSSAWVEFDRGTESAVHRALRELIVDGEPIATTDPIVMEVIAGAKSASRERELRRMFGFCTLLPFHTPGDFDGAATIYRSCRRVGVTPRGFVDCMIAAVALRNGVPVLAHDNDFDRLAAVVGVELASA